MRIFVKLFKKQQKRHLVDQDMNVLRNLVKESAERTESTLCKMHLFYERDHYMLEMSTHIRSTWVRYGGESENSYNKLISYIRIDNNGAKVVGVMMDSPLQTEKSKKLLLDWELHVANYVEDLNNSIKEKSNSSVAETDKIFLSV